MPIIIVLNNVQHDWVEAKWCEESSYYGKHFEKTPLKHLQPKIFWIWHKLAHDKWHNQGQPGATWGNRGQPGATEGNQGQLRATKDNQPKKTIFGVVHTI